MFKVKVFIKRRTSILDPQGTAVEKGAKLLGLNNISGTRINKFIEFNINLSDEQEARKEIELYCSKLLANPIMEDYDYQIEKIK